MVKRDRRLVITVNSSTTGEFLVETEWKNGLGYWTTLSRTVTQTFPRWIITRVASREDYAIIIRSR
jgi:hypothetical protein